MARHLRAPRPYRGGKRTHMTKPQPEHPVPNPGQPGGPGHLDLAFNPNEPRDARGRWTIDPANIVKRFMEATPGERRAGAEWYPQAHKTAVALAKRYKIPVTEAAGLLAAYSPQTPWGRNQVLASEVLREGHALGGPGARMYFTHDDPSVEDKVGLMATGQTKTLVDKVMHGEDFDTATAGRTKTGSIHPKALKIRSFYHLIAEGKQADPNNPYVVIDRHAMSVAFGERVTEEDYAKMHPGSGAKYAPFVQAYKDAAAEITRLTGKPISPEAVQSTTWLVQQRRNAAEVTRVGKTRAKLGMKDWDEWTKYASRYLGFKPPEQTGYTDLANPSIRRTRAAAKALLDDEGTGQRMSVSEMLMRRKFSKAVSKTVESITSKGTATRPNARLMGHRLSLPIRLERDTEALYRGAYALKAAERLTAAGANGEPMGDAIKREARYFAQHEAARKARLEAVTDAQKVAMWTGLPTEINGTTRHLVGWYMNPLLHNDPECKVANGHNFYAEEGTIIGYPGGVHANCGCYAGQPHIGAGLVDDAIRAANVVSLQHVVSKPTLSRRRKAA